QRVVGWIMIDGERAAGTNVTRERRDRLFRRWRVLNDAETDDEIERAGREGKFQRVRLADEVLRTEIATVCVVRFNRRREIASEDARAGFEHHFSEATSAAADFKHALTFDNLERAAETAFEAIPRDGGAGVGVELCFAKLVPLAAKGVGVVVSADETRNVVDDGDRAAVGTCELGSASGERLVMVWAA